MPAPWSTTGSRRETAALSASEVARRYAATWARTTEREGSAPGDALITVAPGGADEKPGTDQSCPLALWSIDQPNVY